MEEDFQVDDLVEMRDDWLYCQNHNFYPKQGTKGRIKSIQGDSNADVRWEKGSTSLDDLWNVPLRNVRKIKPTF